MPLRIRSLTYFTGDMAAEENTHVTLETNMQTFIYYI